MKYLPDVHLGINLLSYRQLLAILERATTVQPYQGEHQTLTKQYNA